MRESDALFDRVVIYPERGDPDVVTAGAGVENVRHVLLFLGAVLYVPKI